MELLLNGKVHEIKAFIHYFKSQPYFEVKQKEIYEKAQGEAEITAMIKFSTSLLKPSIRNIVCVELQTELGQTIKIDLLDPKVSKIADCITQVRGVNYDIFA